jgi:glycerol uptake facilitator-like aquaporin
VGSLPNELPLPPTTAAGIFGTAPFFGPLIGAITTLILVPILIYTFSGVSGAHFNPLITIGTLMVRVTSLPRAILYVAFQIIGASLAGLMLRAAHNTRDFLVGGCYLFEDVTPVHSAVAVEFMGCFGILFLAFGVGLDPRQATIFGPALAPALVGLAVAVVSFGLSFSQPGYGGASLNPARCFGIYVGSRFPGWHWVHWTMTIAGSLAHAAIYALVPPWTSGMNAEKAHAKLQQIKNALPIVRDKERGDSMVMNQQPVQAHQIGRQHLGPTIAGDK